MSEGALAPAPGAEVPAGGEPPRRASGRQGLVARLWQSERGTALVEFALVSPILFLLALGILDFGRALNYYNHLTQLAGQGARAAVVNQNPDGSGGPTTDSRCGGSADNSIQCELAMTYAIGGLRNSNLDVCIDQQAQPTQPVTLTASYDFQFIPFIGAVVGSPTITLSASQTERQEAPNAAYAAGCVDGLGNWTAAP